jgi:hypothetical protein
MATPSRADGLLDAAALALAEAEQGVLSAYDSNVRQQQELRVQARLLRAAYALIAPHGSLDVALRALRAEPALRRVRQAA